MNRTIVLGIAILFAVVCIALVGGETNMAKAREVIDVMQFGATYALKVVTIDGVPVQKVDPAGAAEDALVSIVDIDQPGRDYVRVRMIPGKLNMA